MKKILALVIVSFSFQFSPWILSLSKGNSVHAQSVETDTLSEVVVTGTNNAIQRNLLPYTVSTVTQKQIEATGRTQLLSALNGRIPSLFVTERNILGFGISNGGSGGIKMRGVGGSPTSEVLMMVDGKPQFAGVYSHHIADNYESEYVDHVEVVRGPSSVLYGSNAMGGTINVITKTPKQDGVKTTVQSQYGSYNTWQTAATNMVRKGKFSSVVSAGYDRTDGTQRNFDFWQASGYAKVGYDFSLHWNAYGDYSIMKYKGNDPIYLRIQKEPKDKDVHQDVLRGEASLVGCNTYDKTNGAVRVYFSHGTHDIEDPNPFEMLDNRIGVLAYQNYQPWKMTNFTLGFDFDRYTGEVPLSGGKSVDSGAIGTMSFHQIKEYSPYLTASQGIWSNLVVLNAGIRVSNSNMFGTHVIPQGGFSVNPGKEWTVKASVAKGYRNPSFKELYIYYPRSKNNQDLKPEQMWNYEVSFCKRFSHYLNIELTGFIAKGSNLITLDQNNKNVNTGSFTNKGIEFSATSRPVNSLDLHATYSYLHSDIDKLTGAPRHLYSLGADWLVPFQSPSLRERVRVALDLIGVGGLYVADDVKQQSYALLNLNVTYKVLKYLDLFVQGNNLTDARYCINKGYQMPGITATGGFKFSF